MTGSPGRQAAIRRPSPTHLHSFSTIHTPRINI